MSVPKPFWMDLKVFTTLARLYVSKKADTVVISSEEVSFL